MTPTILSFFGLPIPSHIEGKALPCLPQTAETRLDPALAQPYAGPHHSPFEYTAEEQAIIEQRLADLGYLE